MWQLWIKIDGRWIMEGFYATKEIAYLMRSDYPDNEDYQVCRVEV